MGVEIVDYTAVPVGLAIMAAYHTWLFRQIIRRPTTTVAGVNAIYRRLWVLSIMENSSKDGLLGVQTLRNHIMASTLLASTTVMLSAAVTVMMIGGCGGRGGRPIEIIYGDISDRSFVIRFFSILMCLMMCFMMNVQSIRYHSHASMLIVIASKNMNAHCDHSKNVGVEYVCKMVNRGFCFWSLGLRALYLSFVMFLWIFGPIPMLACCVLMVFLLYYLDFTFDFKNVLCNCEEIDKDEEANVCK